MCFLFNRTTLPSFCYIPYRCCIYVHPLWFYKHQHDNPVRSKLSVACQRWRFQWRFWFVPSVPPIHTHLVSWNCAYRLRMELTDGGCFPNLVPYCRWTIVLWYYCTLTFILNNPVYCVYSAWGTVQFFRLKQSVRAVTTIGTCSNHYRYVQ